MTKKKLNEISRLLNGYAFKSSKYVQSGLRVIRIANVQDGYLSDSEPCFYPIETTTELEQFLLKPHDLLMSLTGNVGRVAFIEKEYLPAGLNQRVECIRPFNESDKEYLYYFFRSPIFQRESLKASHGSAQLNLSTVWLANFYVVYPDEEKRKTAVNTLRTIDNLIREKRNQLIELDSLIKSRFMEMFGNYFEDSRYFVKVGDIATATIGLTYKPNNVADEGIIVLRSGNIKNAELCLSDDIVRVSNIKIKEDKFVRENDILMCSRNGSARLIGKCCLIPKLNEQMSYGAFMTVIRSKCPYFLNGFFNSSYFLQQLTGTQTASVNQITTGMLNGYTVIKPRDAEESEFAKFCKLVDKSRFVVQKEIKDLQELLDSKMDEYFGGEE